MKNDVRAAHLQRLTAFGKIFIFLFLPALSIFFLTAIRIKVANMEYARAEAKMQFDTLDVEKQRLNVELLTKLSPEALEPLALAFNLKQPAAEDISGITNPSIEP
jgi:hypothetical protein